MHPLEVTTSTLVRNTVEIMAMGLKKGWFNGMLICTAHQSHVSLNFHIQDKGTKDTASHCNNEFEISWQNPGKALTSRQRECDLFNSGNMFPAV